jgi:beta-lactam-binding protein with PASTA domain
VVPDVEGKTLDEAREVLYAAGFYKLRVEYLEADFAPGTVLTLSEAAGNTVSTDKEILILVAQGETSDEDVVLPNHAFVIPGHDETVEVTIRCNDAVVLTKKVPAGVEVVTLTISGKGAKQYHIYINGDYCNTETVVFEAHE